MFDSQEHANDVASLKSLWERGAEKCETIGLNTSDVGKTMVGVGVHRWLQAEGSENVVLGLMALIDFVSATPVEIRKFDA